MAGTMDLGKARIGQISITVHDLERAVAFYKETLNLKHLFTVPKMDFFDCGGVRLMLAVPESRSSTIRARCSTSVLTKFRRSSRGSLSAEFDSKGRLT